MINRSLLAATVILGFSLSANASVSFQIDGDLLKDSSGVAIPQNSLFLLVSSVNSANFDAIVAGSSTSVGSLLNTDDRIIARGDLSAFGENGVLNTSVLGTILDSTTAGANAGWNPGDPLALLWFPTLTTASGTIATGTTYGLYTNAVAVDGSDPWITPADGVSNHRLYFYNQSGGSLKTGTNSAASGNASLTVGAVPEPNRAVLGMLGLIGLALRRRGRR
jgi:hypothetical protein